MGNPEKMTGQAFVSFVTKQDRNNFLDNYKKRGILHHNFGCFGHQHERLELAFHPEIGHNPFDSSHQNQNASEGNLASLIKETRVFPVYAEPADEPTDVYWKNLAYSHMNLFFRKSLALMFTLSVLFTSLIAVTYFNMLFVRHTKWSNSQE